MNVNEKITQLCKNNFSNLDICAIYLAGSRMRHTARKDSDYDLIIVINPTLESTFLHQSLFSKQIAFEDNNIEYDCKLYEKAKFYELIMKCGPQIFEVLQAEPIYCTPNDKQLFEFIYTNRNRLFLIDPVKTFKSGKGIIKNVNDQLTKTNDPNKITKYQVLIESQLKILAKFLHTTVANQNIDILAYWESNLLPEYHIDNKLRQQFKAEFINNLLDWSRDKTY